MQINSVLFMASVHPPAWLFHVCSEQGAESQSLPVGNIIHCWVFFCECVCAGWRQGLCSSLLAVPYRRQLSCGFPFLPEWDSSIFFRKLPPHSSLPVGTVSHLVTIIYKPAWLICTHFGSKIQHGLAFDCF